MKKYLYLFFGFYFISLIFPACKESTKPEIVTFSGTVTLEDTTNYSGITVSLYKPVDLDTALTNLNENYPGIGIEINQRTEFFWREHEPIYTTTTDVDGTWEINKVEPGEYHIVVWADDYGWKVKYNASTPNENNITLRKIITWRGIYSQSQTIPEGSFVQVAGITNFTVGSQLTIEAGTIIEFKNDAELSVFGDFFSNGDTEKSIFIYNEKNSNRTRIFLEDCQSAVIDRTTFYNINRGVHIQTSDNSKISNSIFRNSDEGLNLWNCENIMVDQCLFTTLHNALVLKSCKSALSQNGFVNITGYGISSYDARNSFMDQSVIKNCNEVGLGLNPAGYHYNLTIFVFEKCDFINNTIHLMIGSVGNFSAKNCNFLMEQNLIAQTLTSVASDTLNFQYNYWFYKIDAEIESKILHGVDYLGTNQSARFINYSNYYYDYYDWVNAAIN
jgi:copper-binding protein NosD/polysaccharide lyase family 4-like protein